MGWTAIFDIINKVLPGREESIRNKIDALERKRDALDPESKSFDRDYARIIEQLRVLRKKLENR